MGNHELFRKNIREVDLERLQGQFRGARYNRLVQRHIRTLGYEMIVNAVRGCVEALDEDEAEAACRLIDEYNLLGYDKAFWRRDCAQVLVDICRRFAELLRRLGREAEDKIKFDVFQLVTLNFAQMALKQPALRKHAGIRRSFFRR